MRSTNRLKYILFTVTAIFFGRLIFTNDHLVFSNPAASALWGQTAPKRAFATFLSTRVTDEFEDDPYFTATRVLAYQLLHNPQTRLRNKTPFIVLVLPHVSEKKRQILREEGAEVILVDLIEPRRWKPRPGTERWIDQFAKLQLFGLTQYDRIVYLDSDILVTRPLDEIWNEEVVVDVQKTNYESFNSKQEYISAEVLPKEYVFAGVIDYAGPGSESPILLGSHPRLNGGFFALKPDDGLLAYYISILNHDKALFDERLMEQSLLNYAHRKDGPMPWIPLPPRRYCTNWPQLADLEAGSAILHDKFWNAQNKDWISRELVDMWWRVQGKMEGYWQLKDESKRKKQS